MARHDALPTETWSFVFAQLDMADRISFAATCRYFRAFRALAWAQIMLPTHDLEIRKLAKRLMRLAATLKADPSLQPLIRALYLCRPRGPNHLPSWDHFTDDGELDVAIAGILYLAPRVECFVFEAPASDSRTDDQVVEALCKLPALKMLALSQLWQSAPGEYYLESRVLERLIISRKGGADYYNFIGEQKLLKSVELPVQSELLLNVATSWVALEELTIAETFELWPDIVARGLVIVYHSELCFPPLTRSHAG
jgi:hypothetical protein